MVAISVVLLVVLVWGLGSYTHHGEEVAIPEIRGKSMHDAAQVLSDAGLSYEIVDSIYDKAARPGSVREALPEVGSKVKPGRIIFLTIYASSPRKLSLPLVENMSSRQAMLLLRALGFEQVDVRIVSGEYRDLCLGITDAAGKAIAPGTPLAKDTRLVMLVSGVVRDSLTMDDLIDTSDHTEWRPDDTSRSKPDSTQQDPSNEPERWW